jgi:hypothetical protein
MHAHLAASLLLVSVLAHAAEIHGKVEGVIGGEPLARVQVSLLETGAQTVTDKDGNFAITGLPPGNFTLRLNAVGYRLLTVPFVLSEGEASKEFSITLVPDNFRRTDTVEVKGDIFHGPDSPAVIETNLTSSELRETSTVLADDPFRAIQALPGVSASGNNDFNAEFSVMGAPFEEVSTYLDGILVPQPFHSMGNLGAGASLSVVTSETVQDVRLLPVAYPENYGDAVGAAVDLHTRDGSRTPPLFRASIGMADSDVLGEGQLGRGRKGSWLASARKSYLGYLLRSRLHETFTDISFCDGDLKLTYDLAPRHALTFYAIGGRTDAELVHAMAPLGANDFKHGINDFVMVRTGWRWSVSPHLVIDTRAAYLQAPFSIRNSSAQLLQRHEYDEWVAGSDVVWNWRSNQILEGGWTARRIHSGTNNILYEPNGIPPASLSGAGTGWRNTGNLQHTSALLGNRIHVLASLRFDSADRLDVHPVAPQVSASIRVASATHIELGWGHYSQFDFPQFPIDQQYLGLEFCFPSSEFLKTADHFTAGAERRLGESVRVRAAFFDRQNHRYLAPVNCPGAAQDDRFHSVGRDYSRGVQLVLQSRTANRLAGWIGYTLTYARQDGLFYYSPKPGEVAGAFSPYYPTLQDQRHTLNVFVRYRVAPTVSLSGKWLFGSGFPLPGGQILVDPQGRAQFVGINAARMGNYQRLDVRGEKDWAFSRWKLALYGEVLNLTNHDNRRFVTLTSPAPSTGWVAYQIQQGLPITPTTGVAFEF